MAPKVGKKRAAAAAAEEPAAKKITTFLKEQGVSKSMHKAVAEIVNHPLSGLDENCQKMLLAMLPWSVCVASEERDEPQNMAVGMIKEVAEAIKRKLEEAIEKESASLVDVDKRKEELQAGVDEASAAVASAAADADASKVKLGDASAELLRKKEALAEAERVQAEQIRTNDANAAQKAEITSVLEGSFEKLKNCDWETAQEAEGLCNPLKALAEKLTLDASMLTAMHSSMTKKERSQFDVMVVTQIEESLRAKLAEVCEAEATSRGKVAEVAALVEAASNELQSATSSQKELAAELDAKQEASSAAMAALHAAQQALADADPDFAKAAESRDAKKADLQTFTEYNIVCLGILVDRTKEKPEVKKEAATEEAATEQVETEEVAAAEATS